MMSAEPYVMGRSDGRSRVRVFGFGLGTARQAMWECGPQAKSASSVFVVGLFSRPVVERPEVALAAAASPLSPSLFLSRARWRQRTRTWSFARCIRGRPTPRRSGDCSTARRRRSTRWTRSSTSGSSSSRTRCRLVDLQPTQASMVRPRACAYPALIHPRPGRRARAHVHRLTFGMGAATHGGLNLSCV